MSTHTAISYHTVFSTKNRTPVLRCDHREDLFRFIWGIIKTTVATSTASTVWKIIFTPPLVLPYENAYPWRCIRARLQPCRSVMQRLVALAAGTWPQGLKPC